jgi:hypothetical protein
MDERPVNVAQTNQSGVAWINILLGIWVLISPWVLVFGPHPVAVWNNVATGAAVILVAALRGSMPQQSSWSWLNGLLAIWLIISPFVLGYVNPAAIWNNVILGIIIGIVALSSVAMKSKALG